MAKGKETILIVDDDKGVRKLLRQRLEDEGYRCKEAGSAGEALARLGSSPPGVVLLDIKMPDKSGMELLPEIKERYPDVVVIMVTGISDVTTAIAAMRQGAYNYITKPFNLDEVVHSVARAVEKRKLELELRDYQQHLEQKVEEQAKEIRETFLGAMAALSFALEAKDSYTAGHSRRVSEIALAIGKELGLSEEELEDLRWGSLLHDIGKIAVDQAIQNKPGKLTPQEYEHIMTHCIVGASIVRPVVRSERIVEIIEHHHAHYNGGGLNQTLRGEKIPLLARIVAVADAYDAMTSTRPYRTALSREAALAEIQRGMGTQFDPLVAQTFLKLSGAELMPQKKKILVVDDEESIRVLVRSILSNDYEVIEATDGQEAVQVARDQRPDLILMDILMPRLDGYTSCHMIKTDPTTCQIPVIMLTGVSHKLNVEISKEFGADEYMTKPFSPQSLLETVNRFLTNHPEGVIVG